MTDTLWPTVQDALEQTHDVLLGRKAAFSAAVKHKMEWNAALYRAINEKGASSTAAQRYHDRYRKWIDARVTSVCVPAILDACATGSPSQVCTVVSQQYSAWRKLLTFARCCLQAVDVAVAKTRNCPELSVVSLFHRAFHAAVYEKVKGDLRNVILAQVNERRHGNQIDLAVLREAIAVFLEVGTCLCKDEAERKCVYAQDFEAAYLSATRNFYTAASARELAADGGSFTFLTWVDTRIDLEKRLAADIMGTSAEVVVVEAVHQATIQSRYETLIRDPDSGCAVLLEDWKLADLARMYRLMKRVKDQKALHIMGQAMQERIEQEGKKLMEAFSEAVSDGPLSLERPLVSEVLELNDKYGDLIKKHFEGSGVFYDYRKKAFKEVLQQPLVRKDPKPQQGEGAVDQRATSFSEVLATYCDAVMKRELKDVVDPDAELERLDGLLQVFTYIVEKDVFQEFYKSRLAKRLLQTTPSEDLEKAFLERLQREMGKSYTHKMEGMLMDRDSTKQHAEKFNQDAASKGLSCEFDVQVLTEAHWPSYKADTLVPPPSLRQCIDAFTRFYKRSNATRKLTWINMLGQATLQIKFAKGPKEVTASLYQASVLVTIDERGAASTQEIVDALGMDIKAVKQQIAGMYLHKVFCMLNRVDESGEKQPVGKQIGDTDRFALNQEFMHKMRKFKLPVAAVSSGSGGSGMPTDSEIDGRRKIQVDAAVVRIMKSRKTLSYTELQDLVITQLSKQFAPQPKMIKQRVEELVTREYLRRHEDNPKMFDYLA